MGHQSFFETEKSPQTRMNTKKNVPDSKIRHIICQALVEADHRKSAGNCPFGFMGGIPFFPRTDRQEK